MAKSKDINDSQSITTFIEKLEPAFGKIVQEIRGIILNTSKEIGEQIKWNSPSFFYTGEMKPFDPKEYKRDIVVVNIRKNIALLIFPTGATIKDTAGILEGDYKDGRRMITFTNMDDVKAKEKDLRTVILDWLKLIEK